MLQVAKDIAKKSFKYIGLDVKRVPPPITTIDMYRRLYGEESVRARRFYNIGAGQFRHEAWTNVDNPSDYYDANFKNNPGVIAHDLQSLKPLPIDTNSAELVYSSHCVEHIDAAANEKLFEEVYRVLKPGGFFRVTAPDMELFYRAYLLRDADFFYWFEQFKNDPDAVRRARLTLPPEGASLGQIFLFEFASTVSEIHADGAPERVSDAQLDRMFAEDGFEKTLDYCSSRCPLDLQAKYPGNHINWFTKDKLVAAMKRAGFTDVYVSAYGQSLAPPLRDTNYFDNTQPRLSLYVEARK